MSQSRPDYLLIGHITADIVPDGRILGGTVSYAAHNVAAFDLSVALVTSAVPDDPLLKDLPSDVACHVVPAQATTTYENVYDGEDRTQFVRSVAATIDPASIPEAWRKARLVHLAPLADEITSDMIDLFPHSRILVTPQGWMRQWDASGRVRFRRWFDERVLRRADLVVLSIEDIASELTLEQAYRDVTRRLVVTRGLHGGQYYVNGEASSYDAVPARLVDPTGAGDIFASSLFAAWDRLGSFEAAIPVAARIAAQSVERPGISGTARPAEVRAIFERMP